MRLQDCASGANSRWRRRGESNSFGTARQAGAQQISPRAGRIGFPSRSACDVARAGSGEEGGVALRSREGLMHDWRPPTLGGCSGKRLSDVSRSNQREAASRLGGYVTEIGFRQRWAAELDLVESRYGRVVVDCRKTSNCCRNDNLQQWPEFEGALRPRQ